MTAGPIPCAYCTKTFKDENARWSHTKMRHPGKKNLRPPRAKDDEESFADRAVQAEIDRACGIDNPDIDWLLP